MTNDEQELLDTFRKLSPEGQAATIQKIEAVGHLKRIIRDEKHILAFLYFAKRVTYEDACRRAHGETPEDREIMAYRILNAIADIEAYFKTGKNLGL
jgi:hypothetical protein